MSARFTWTLAAAALFVGCATTAHGPGALIRLETPDVEWTEGGAFEVELAIYNASGRRMTIARPTQETVELAIYPEQEGGKPVCKSPRATTLNLEPWQGVSLPTGGRSKAVVDARPYCPKLQPGTYRYEARFVANTIRGGDASWTGVIGPEQGKVVVVATSAQQQQQTADQAAEAQARECVDRELAARGLNAYGDAQGTTYPEGPPVQEEGRALYVAARLPELRQKCSIKGF
ncbi:MAG: hypothetical protein QM767_01240 [Anaeromyxobacter sp.]